MNDKIKQSFEQYLTELKNTYLFEKSEYTDRPALQNLLQRLNTQFKTGIRVIHEGKDTTSNKPDFHIDKGDILIGIIENKKMGEKLDNVLTGEQIERYKKYNVPVLVTDYWNFIVIKDNQIASRSCLGSSDVLTDSALKLQNIEETALLINDFFETAIGENITTLSELIRKLSFKTAQIKQFILNGLSSNDPKLEKLTKLLNNSIFEELDTNNFADTIAQMLVYFAVVNKLYHNTEIHTLHDLVTGIPPYLSFIKELLNILDMSIDDNYLMRETFDILNATDITKIRAELSQSNDAFVYFYEDFLRAYDTKMSKDKGVYYTPKPVVDFMIKQSEYFLKNNFGKKGLHDKKVTTLDFATGTGTFMQSIIENILENKQQGDVQELIENHILKNIYAFELMPAPYTVAHIKLSEYLINKGYTFKKDERLQIYITNTLTKSNKANGLFFDELDNEMNTAQEIKEKNILFICGNPPYNNNTQNKNSITSRKNKVEEKPFDNILKLLEDYKHGLTGKNDKYAVNNDYIKFIRFAHDKVLKAGQGMIAVITPNSFLEKISFRVMRERLIKDFDEIYIVDLHGESGTRGDKVSADDQNVFDIEEGVCITYLIKNKESKSENALVKYTSLTGTRAFKFDELEKMKNADFESLDWQTLNPNKDNVYTLTATDIDYNQFNKENFWRLDTIFSNNSAGIMTKKDPITIHNTKEKLENMIQDMCILTEQQLIEKYKQDNGSEWNWTDAIDCIKNTEKRNLSNIHYRPFDIRYTTLSISSGFINRPMWNTMKHMLYDNMGLCMCKTNTEEFTHTLISKYPIEYKTAHRTVNSMFAPLYLYDDTGADIDKQISHKTENFTAQFRKFVDAYYGTHYTPEQILYYIYAVLHHQGYRDKYNEELKKDFAYIPFVASGDIFLQLSELGEKLALAHTDYIIPNNYKYTSEHVGVTSDFSIQSREVKVKDNKLYYNKTNYFDNVGEDVYNFKIGGYNVLKTLIAGSIKQPKLKMSSEERDHVETVISVLRYTIDTMKEIAKIEVVGNG